MLLKADTMLCQISLQLLIFLLPAWLLSRVAANNNANVEFNSDSKTKRDEEGGLRWNNLGVSFEPCDGYDGDCSDDSMWLLHPSSGFVKNGWLCGILGPSGE